jgi:peptidoglycan/xylan/chitin deacetylase (PgdA/CDA1 family)
MAFNRWIILSLVVCSLAAAGIGMYLYLNQPKPAPPVVIAPPPPKPEGPPPFSPTVYEPMSVRNQSARIPVIMYHDVVKERGRGSVYFDCTVAELKQHLKYIEENGITPISLETLHRHLVRGEPVPEKAVVLTFDDNYQGFFDNAYPLLKEKKIPAAMFVHTNFVGDKTGDHPKMDWEELKTLDKEGLITIGPHTLSHPDDLTALPEEKQTEEITECKSVLEKQLGHPTPYFCYPVGKNNDKIRAIAQAAGYTMAFTMENGPVEESPGILQLNRYIQTRFERAFQEAESARANTPANVFEVELKDTPVRLEVAEFDGTKLGMVRGGIPRTWKGKTRRSVGQFVSEAGGVAGINGTFFADARIIGTDATMIGPCLTGNISNVVGPNPYAEYTKKDDSKPTDGGSSTDGNTGADSSATPGETPPPDASLDPVAAQPGFAPDLDAYRLTRLKNRPVVLISPKKFMIVPFQPGYMNDLAPYKIAMPEVTDLFLAGAWIVHDGVARTEEQLQAYSAGDFADPRRRAFFGVMADGEIVVGGTLEVVSTQKMAEAAAAAGVKEAVLLDSGFSTSIVYDNKIIVTGHTAEHSPSRPVPHAIVLYGKLEQPTDPEIVKLLSEAKQATEPEGATIDSATEEPRPRRRRRRRRSHSTSVIDSRSAARIASVINLTRKIANDR